MGWMNFLGSVSRKEKKLTGMTHWNRFREGPSYHHRCKWHNHQTSHFCDRQQDAFDKIAELTREHKCWTYMKPHARVRNGRAAYMAFKNHYLGPNNIGNMAATAEHKLINATYREEGRHWDIERYATLHKEQHTILEGLKEYGYAGMDERSKTRYLLAGIKTTGLDSVKTQILCNAELRQDFAKCGPIQGLHHANQG